MQTPQIEFWGATGTVTGSKYLLRAGDYTALIDCGLFQGDKTLRQRNWQAPPFDPAKIDAVILSHAHIDHSGYIPLLIKRGFTGQIYCTSATQDLCEILLPDSGFLQEKHADYANNMGFSRHNPAMPLYTEQDARKSLSFFNSIPFHTKIELTSGFHFKFLRAGHILGASIICIDVMGRRMVFSGDLGRFNSPTLPVPDTPCNVDFLVLESTYGAKIHSHETIENRLADIISKTVQRGGTVIIPCFAVGRTQIILYYLHKLKSSGILEDVPVFLDSPMAINASDIYCRHPLDHKFSTGDCQAIFNVAQYVRSVDASKELTKSAFPKIILSASGMATGGRVLHHLKSYLSDEKNAVIFTGFQAQGTRGEALVNGAETIRIHGLDIPVRADVWQFDELSAHADRQEIMTWLRQFNRAPRRVFITHGEPEQSYALSKAIRAQLAWSTHIPNYGESVSLS